jgi:glycine/D-amino acid oxidase-like deaminating enzyme
MSPNAIRQAAAEYIVVGSGAGGGTVAARLAEAGRTVLLASGFKGARLWTNLR